MAKCLHFCEEYKVSNSHDCIGNWQQERINYVLRALVDKFSGEFWYSDDSLEYSDHIEIDKDTIGKIIIHLEKAGDEWGDVEFNNDNEEFLQRIVSELGKDDITPLSISEFLYDALHNGEKTIDYVHFTWL